MRAFTVVELANPIVQVRVSQLESELSSLFPSQFQAAGGTAERNQPCARRAQQLDQDLPDASCAEHHDHIPNRYPGSSIGVQCGDDGAAHQPALLEGHGVRQGKEVLGRGLKILCKTSVDRDANYTPKMRTLGVATAPTRNALATGEKKVRRDSLPDVHLADALAQLHHHPCWLVT